MDFWAEHWLSVGVGVFWLSMILYGHYRGLVRIAVTMSALILSLVVTRVAMPCVTAVLNENTAVHQAIGQGLLHMAGVKDENEAAEETEIQPAYQRNIIEGLKLPEQMKEVLLENNNSEIYHMLGVDRFFDYFRQFGLMDLTGVDIPGEAGTIMHKKENVGQVELATISFGQSFQITPIQLATTVSALVNGGRRVTPHFGMEVLSAEGKKVKTFRYNAKKHIVSEKTSQTMRELLESVVAEGSGKNAYVEGYRIGGKTATSQTLPRSANKYISSFVGFAPADDPQILGMCVIYNPQGVYYGGTIAAPVIGKIFENILPYLGIEKQ